MNSLIVSGYLTADIETRPAGEHKVQSFTIAVKQGEHTTFLFTEAWDMPHLEKHLHKGSKVLIRGCIKQSNWETSEGERRSRLLATAYEVEFIGAPPRTEPDVRESDRGKGDRPAHRPSTRQGSLPARAGRNS